MYKRKHYKVFGLLIFCFASHHSVSMQPEFQEDENVRIVDEGERLLKAFDFKAGFDNLEHRLALHKDMPQEKNLTHERYTQGLAGKKILIRFAGGISARRKSIGHGDIFLLLRYAVLLKELGAQALIELPRPLKPIITRCHPTLPTVDADNIPLFDYQIGWASLPHVCGAYDVNSIPPSIPYLHANQDLIKKWREILIEGKSNDSLLHVGICWKASNLPPLNRNIPLSAFYALLQIKSIQLFSLQGGVYAEEIKEEQEKLRLTVFDNLDQASLPYEDTAALIDLFDAIITVDTSLLGLAGALGAKNTYGLLPAECDWRWGTYGTYSPWYPTLHLLRQSPEAARKQDWSEVISELVAELTKLCS